MEDSDGERKHLSLAAYNMTFRHSSRLSCRFFFSLSLLFPARISEHKLQFSVHCMVFCQDLKQKWNVAEKKNILRTHAHAC